MFPILVNFYKLGENVLLNLENASQIKLFC